jgi:hypothetical protein
MTAPQRDPFGREFPPHDRYNSTVDAAGNIHVVCYCAGCNALREIMFASYLAEHPGGVK